MFHLFWRKKNDPSLRKIAILNTFSVDIGGSNVEYVLEMICTRIIRDVKTEKTLLLTGNIGSYVWGISTNNPLNNRSLS